MPPYLNFTSLNKLLHCIVNIYACVLYVCIDCLLLCHSCCMARVVFVNKVLFCSVLFCYNVPYGTLMAIKHLKTCFIIISHWPSVIAVCYSYRIKLYRINIIRDMVMQLNVTHLPKTGQYSKHMVASQTSWL